MGADETIKGAFCALLEKKTYDQITVAEICRTAHVSSKTFYKYFDGRPGLVRSIMYDDWAAPILQVREVLPLDHIQTSTQMMVEQSFDRVWQKRNLYRNLFKHYGRTELADDVTHVLSELNRGIYFQYNLPEEELEFVVQLYSSMKMPIIYWWITEHDDIPPKRMADYYVNWCFDHWKKILENRPASQRAAGLNEGRLSSPNRGGAS